MKTSFCIILGSLTFAIAARAQTTYVAGTPAVGCAQITARGASDSFVSIPLVQRSALIARVSAVSASALTVSAAVADGAYAPAGSTAYYLQFVSGKLAGLCYGILNNQAGVFTLNTHGDDLTNHPLGTVSVGNSGDLVRIRPLWTIGTVFGADPTQILLDPVAGLNGSIYAGADAILLPDNSSPGTEKPPSKTIAYVTGSGWRERSALSVDAGATPLWPGVPFTIRRQNSTPANILVAGYVSEDPFMQSMPAPVGGADMDVAVSLAFPLPVTLANSGLSSANTPLIAPSVSSSQLGDLVLDYSAVRSGFSLPPDKRFYVIGSDWFETGAAADQNALQPEAGYILRFRGVHSARYWTQSPPPSP